jgi:hypothetical protein
MISVSPARSLLSPLSVAPAHHVKSPSVNITRVAGDPSLNLFRAGDGLHMTGHAPSSTSLRIQRTKQLKFPGGGNAPPVSRFSLYE